MLTLCDTAYNCEFMRRTFPSLLSLFLPVFSLILIIPKLVFAWEISLCLPSILCVESTAESGNGSGGPWAGVQPEAAPWEGAEPGGGTPSPAPPNPPDPPPAPPSWYGEPLEGPLTIVPELASKIFWMQDYFSDLMQNNPATVAQNAQVPLVDINQGSNLNQTSARFGDPVDPITGALKLDIPLVAEKGGYQNLSLSASYNHQFSSPIQLFGRGWSLTGNEIFTEYGWVVPEGSAFGDCRENYITPAGSLQFRFDINNDFLQSRNYIRGVPVWMKTSGVRLTGDDIWPLQFPSTSMMAGGVLRSFDNNISTRLSFLDPSGQTKVFAGGLIPPTRFCGYINGLNFGSCLYMIHYRSDLLDKFIPIGYSLVVAEIPGANDYQYVWQRDIRVPTHWLTEVHEKDKLALSIKRRVTFTDNFDFPGKIACGNDLDCLSDAGRNTPNYPYRVPLPDTLTMTYQTPDGETATVTARWHLQRVEGPWEGANAVRVFKFMPYVVEINTNTGRQWKFDYEYPSALAGMTCPYNLNTADAPADVIRYMDANLHDPFEVCQPYSGGTLTRNSYTGPLFLAAIHHPDPQTGLATGPTQIFQMDDLGRIKKSYDLSGINAATTVTFDTKNRVATQQIGTNPPIQYSILDRDQMGQPIDMVDGLGNHFIGYEVTIQTSALDTSKLVVQTSTGQVRYAKELFPDDAGLNTRAKLTTYEYRPTLGVADVPHPDNWLPSVISGTLRHVVHHDTGLEEFLDLRGNTIILPPNDPSNYTYQNFFRAFQLGERRLVYTDEGQQKTLRWTYQYVPSPAPLDTIDSLRSVTDPLNRTTTFGYDFEEANFCQTHLNLPVVVTLPDGTRELFDYNHKGQLINYQDRLGASMSYEYYGTNGGCGQP